MTAPEVNGFTGKFDLTNDSLEKFKLIDRTYKNNIFVNEISFPQNTIEARCPDHRVKVGDIVTIGGDANYNGTYKVTTVVSANTYQFTLYTGPPVNPDLP